MQSTQEPEPPTSATRQVWAVPELVGMILSHLEPREIMVCKRIDRFTQEVINNNVNLEVGKKIWTRPTGTQRVLWALRDESEGDSIGQIAYTKDKKEAENIYDAGWMVSERKTLLEPLIANPLLVKTSRDENVALTRAVLAEGAAEQHEETNDLCVLLMFLVDMRRQCLKGTLSYMEPRSTATLQNSSWLNGTASTSSMQLFDPPIYGRLKCMVRAKAGKVKMSVIRETGCDTAITWGAVGKAYKRAVARYTKRQLKTYDTVYNHAETDKPLPLEIRVDHHLLVDRDMCWWVRRLLEGDRRFDLDWYGRNSGGRPEEPEPRFEFARGGYTVPATVDEYFRMHITRKMPLAN